MKILVLALMIILPTLGFAEVDLELKCRVDEPVMGGAKVDVPVMIIKGSQIKPVSVTEFKGVKFSAVWMQGDQFEPQAVLQMNFGDIHSAMYDFTLEGHVGPINVISHNGLRFQCWVEKL